MRPRKRRESSGRYGGVIRRCVHDNAAGDQARAKRPVSVTNPRTDSGLPTILFERLKNLCGRHVQLNGVDREGRTPQSGADPGIELRRKGQPRAKLIRVSCPYYDDVNVSFPRDGEPLKLAPIDRLLSPTRIEKPI